MHRLALGHRMWLRTALAVAGLALVPAEAIGQGAAVDVYLAPGGVQVQGAPPAGVEAKTFGVPDPPGAGDADANEGFADPAAPGGGDPAPGDGADADAAARRAAAAAARPIGVSTGPPICSDALLGFGQTPTRR